MSLRGKARGEKSKTVAHIDETQTARKVTPSVPHMLVLDEGEFSIEVAMADSGASRTRRPRRIYRASTGIA